MKCPLACAHLLLSLALLLSALAPCQAKPRPSAATPAPLNEADGYRFAFQYDPPRIPYIIIQVSINGKPPLPFMLDTGTNAPVIIDTKVVQRLGLPMTAYIDSANAGRVSVARAAAVTLVRFPGLAKGRDFDFKAQGASVVDLMTVQKDVSHIGFAGIIGMGLLNRYTVRLDFSHKILTLYLRPHSPILIPRATVITLIKQKYEDNYFVPVSPIRDICTNLLLDTGSVETSLPQTIANQNRSTPRYGDSTFMLGSYYISQTLLLPKIKVGDYSLDNFSVDTSPTLADCTLGIDFLSCFCVTLDFPHRQMFLEWVADRTYRLHGWDGIRIKTGGKDFRVKAVEFGSPAKAAGLQAEDRILSIDGHSLHGLSPASVSALRNSFAGTQMTFLLQRGQSQPFTLTFVRANLFAAPPDIETGLTVEKPDKQPINVIQVDAGSPAQKAGLAAGDTITAIDGLPSAAMSADQTDDAFGKDTLTLTVRRAGENKPRVLVLAK